jgi:WD40 repeat protein
LSEKTILEFSASSSLLQQLTFSPDGSKLASANIDSAAVWDANTGRKLITFNGHGEGVRTNDVVFSPDGKWIASTGNDSTVKVWAAQTGKVWLTLAGHTGSTFGTAFSPDGHTLATSSVDRTIKIWSLPEQGDSVPDPLTLYGNSGAVYHIAFSPDGARIASAGRDLVVHIYELKVDDLVVLARSRLTRNFTQEECQKYLHVPVCPAAQ